MSQLRGSSTEERRDYILQLLREQDHTTVTGLSQLLDVSEVTIRKDLDALEAQGLLTRVHGGAVYSGRGRFELYFATRQQQRNEEKRRIAQAAAALVVSGQKIFLDASTTAFQIARMIKDRRNLTVVTNGIYNALELTFCDEITVLVTGGVMRQRSNSLVSGFAADLRRLRVDIGFFGARGITPEDGLTETDLYEAQLKQQMIETSQTVIGVVDSSKFGVVDLNVFALPHEIDRIITDTDAPPDAVAALMERDILVDLV